MKKIESILVPKLEKTERLSDYLVGKFQSVSSRKGIKKVISKKLIKVNGKIGFSGDYIKGGEIIQLFRPKEKEAIQLDITVPVLYEDDDLAIINKPAGLTVSGNMNRTLVNALPNILKKSSKKDALPIPQPVHRLDRPTSGVLLIAKTRQSNVLLSQAFAERRIKKTYHTICIGKINDSGKITTPIKEKNAETNYKRIDSIDSDKYDGLNLLEVQLITGRRHQIRIHLSELGHPVLGDKTYGIEGKISKGQGLYLHASSIEFEHPITSEKTSASSPLPEKFKKLFAGI